jgi:LysR family glycine cleavage system transcriptional activator
MYKKPDQLPPLDRVRSFEAAARCLSFTKAAAELFVTQSAVSRAVQSLEGQLGVKLFHRRHRALLLTEAGQALYRTSAEVLEKLRDTIGRIHVGTDSGTLTVTTSVGFASLWLVPRLPVFRERYPEIAVRIAAANEFSDLERECIDVAIRYCVPKGTPKGAVRLFGEELFPVCSPKLLRRGGLRTPEDLRRQVLLHFEEPALRGNWLHWSVWFEAMRLKPPLPERGLSFSHYDQMIQAAVSGQGVALGRTPLVKQLLKQGALVTPFDRRTATSRAYYVITAAGAGERAAVRNFVAWLEEVAARESE